MTLTRLWAWTSCSVWSRSKRFVTPSSFRFESSFLAAGCQGGHRISLECRSTHIMKESSNLELHETILSQVGYDEVA